MSGPDPDPDLDPGMSPADRVRAEEAVEISRDHPGWVVSCDLWGMFRASRGGDEVGPVSAPSALRAMIGTAKPREPSE